MDQITPQQQQILDIVCDTLTIDAIGVDVDLFEAGILDSLSIVQLMVAMEEVFGISITPEELDFEDYSSIRSMDEMVQRIMPHKSAVNTNE